MSFKKIIGSRVLAGSLAAGFLVACASPTDARHGRHHAGASGNVAAPGPSGGAAPCCPMMGGPGGMRHKDKEAMCAMYRGMRDAPDEQARQAMMERHMQAMSPEMRQRHMEMMRQHCQ